MKYFMFAKLNFDTLFRAEMEQNYFFLRFQPFEPHIRIVQLTCTFILVDR